MAYAVAGLLAAAVGSFVYYFLSLYYSRKNRVVRLLDEYTSEVQQTSPEQERQSKVRAGGFWQGAGRMAPRAISERYRPILQKAGIPLKGEEMAGMVAAATVLGGLFGGALMKIPGAIIFALVGYLVPGLVLSAFLKKRTRLAEQQLTEFLGLAANALRAGHSFQQALDLAGREMPDPMGFELRRSLREVSLGLSVEEALLRLNERLPSADLDLIITAVLIQRQVGGDLASIFDGISATIRGRQKLKGQVKSLTAQGRMSGWVISLLPVGLLVIITLINPEHTSLLWRSSIGIVMLVVGIVSQFVGIMVIKKVVNIDI
ncbi:MAG TPA: type II secretion system F family protein [Bacillota bacterium]|nr:type II secretion system F family protein [Bacillota bacterium]